MFKHFLVPLDGSRLGESALPIAAYIARLVKATVTLIHVIEKDAPSEIHREPHLRTAEEATAYLADTAAGPLFAGLDVRRHVHSAEVRDVAKSISEHSEELAPDLIVMSTHGRAGPRRLIEGDLAQQLAGIGATPVLLVRSPVPPAFRAILAPLDGDPAHEECLPDAIALALACGARLHLLMVVPTLGDLSGPRAAAGRFLPGATRMALEMDHAGALEYLESRADEPVRKGVRVTREASRGDPARAIVRSVRREKADLVVMSTHGKAGTEAFWAGSVASRVIVRTNATLLLVPVGDRSS